MDGSTFSFLCSIRIIYQGIKQYCINILSRTLTFVGRLEIDTLALVTLADMRGGRHPEDVGVLPI